jgi:hypothetical protein
MDEFKCSNQSGNPLGISNWNCNLSQSTADQGSASGENDVVFHLNHCRNIKQLAKLAAE